MQTSVRVVDVTHRRREHAGFTTFRERGQNAVLFVHFLSPAKIRIDGKTIDTTRNACIIYTPGVKQDYGSISETDVFENNFVTFETDTLAFFADYDLPLNEPFYVDNEEEITTLVEWITWASANRLRSLDEEITSRVHELFRVLERGIIDTTPKNIRGNHTRQRFVALREEVMLNPSGWTVVKMAQACWLTRSRFYVLYKSFFGTCPKDDLVAGIFAYAKQRLQNSNDSIKSIASECGYKRVESFIRMFNEKQGQTPGQFRKQFLESGE